jgi:argininosuccinate synthase
MITCSESGEIWEYISIVISSRILDTTRKVTKESSRKALSVGFEIGAPVSVDGALPEGILVAGKIVTVCKQNDVKTFRGGTC